MYTVCLFVFIYKYIFEINQEEHRHSTDVVLFLLSLKWNTPKSGISKMMTRYEIQSIGPSVIFIFFFFFPFHFRVKNILCFYFFAVCSPRSWEKTNHLGSTWRLANARRQDERNRSANGDVRLVVQAAAVAVEMGDEAAETAELAGTTSLTFVVSPTLTWMAAAASSPFEKKKKKNDPTS